MSERLVFYTNPMSRGRTTRWMLEEIAVPYETEVLTYGGTMKSPDYLAINPMGKVPAIKHGDTVVTECAAIIAYLADAFPEAGLAPAVDDPRRGAYYRWLFFGAGCVEGAASAATIGIKELDERQRAMAGFGSVQQVIDTLDNALSHPQPYLTGDMFTAADLYIGSQLAWLTSYGVFEKRASFVSYIERTTSREAAKLANQIDEELIAQNPELLPEGMGEGS
ncbi:MAG: glutathione S-transferase family protein [Pseudomonadota bacterium]